MTLNIKFKPMYQKKAPERPSRSELLEKMASKKWTSAQASLAGLLATSSSFLAGNAVAGSGKTSTAQFGVVSADPSKTFLYLAFNKQNATEALSKMPANADCRTFHSHGLQCIKKHQRANVDAKGDKIYTNLNNVKQKWTSNDINIDRSRFAELRTIISLAKSNCIDPRLPYETNEPMLLDLLSDSSFNEEEINHIAATLYEILQEELRGCTEDKIISMDDMCWLPALYGWNDGEERDCLIVDEAQDLNHTQHMMVAATMKMTHQLVIIGDPRQAIYGWRGASDNSFYDLVKMFNMEEIKLTYTFRCPKRVAAIARIEVPHIQAPPDAEQGCVSIRHTAEVMEIINDNFKPGDAIICRNNRPLVQLAIRFITEGKRYTYKNGKDYAKTISRLLQSLKIPNTATATNTLASIEAKILTSPSQTQKKRLKDDYDVLNFLFVHLAERMAPQLPTVNHVMALFERIAESEGSVTLTTIHGAKGLEYENVIFYMPELLGQDGQDGNLWYVAITRATHSLFYCPEMPEKDTRYHSVFTSI